MDDPRPAAGALPVPPFLASAVGIALPHELFANQLPLIASLSVLLQTGKLPDAATAERPRSAARQANPMEARMHGGWTPTRPHGTPASEGNVSARTPRAPPPE